MKRRIGIAMLAFAIVLAYGQPALVAQESTGSRVWKDSLKSAVWVAHTDPKKGGYSWGSGSLIDYKQKLIVTNYHVVRDALYVTVMFPLHDAQNTLITEKAKYIDAAQHSGGWRGKVVFAESRRDIAVIQVVDSKPYPKGTVAIELAPVPPTPGDNVHSVGSPGASAGLFSYTPGACRTVTKKKWFAGDPNDGGFEVEARIIETTSATNHGDSGGPLMNDKGQQIGITQGYMAQDSSGLVNSIAYFIDIAELKESLKERKINLTAYRGPGTDTGKDEGAPATLSSGDIPKKGEEVKPVPAPKEGVAATTPATKPAGTPADEKTASQQLAVVKSLIDSGKKDKARERLAKLLKDFPNTAAGREARDIAKDFDK